MTIVAYVNGARKTAAIHINVACGQIPNDSIASSSAVRKGMTKALQNSNIDSSTSKRVERGGYIYRFNDSGIMFVVDVPSDTQNVCEYNIMLPPPTIAGATPIAHWHTHPCDPGHDRMPSGVCPHDMAGGGIIESRPTPGKDYPGDSESYIWDKRFIYRTYPLSRDKFDRYPRVTATCTSY
jgi:hypothetical protein